MAFLARVVTVIRANMNWLIGQAEDPSKLVEQALDDMQRQFARAKQDVTNAVAEEKKLSGQLQREKEQSAEWEKRAMLAVREKRDDLAKQALQRQAEHDRAVKELEAAWSKHKAATEAVRVRLHEMNARLDELKRKKSLLVARQSSAQAQTRIQASSTSLNEGSGLSTFERMEEKIADMEAKACAAAEMADDLRGNDLEQQFRTLEAGGSEDERLTELKRRMAANPAP